eukprot:GGOE01000538.1.p1 GENE.GGOE01000538.1~~GGOE01000538.1.p1  ORF type:complete len:1117 (+),score=289.83 GGOE01000538.1:298-3351(+)
MGAYEALIFHSRGCPVASTSTENAEDEPPGRAPARLNSMDDLPVRADSDLPTSEVPCDGAPAPLGVACSEEQHWYDKEVQKEPEFSTDLLPSLTPGEPNPIEEAQLAILDAVTANRVVILNAHTGSGKSTTVPWLMLHQQERGAGRVLCTQPRRIAAVALAHRVAALCKAEVGREIGYWIGGQKEFDPVATRLIYMTNSVAMMLLLLERLDCTHLIIDEIHNRTLFDDVLLAMVKMYHLKENPNLRVILMSAATDGASLASYFREGSQLDVPILQIGHRVHHVREVYLDDIPLLARKGELTMADVGDLLWQLHLETSPAAVFLVFLAGRGDIAEVTEHLEEFMEEHLAEGALDLQALHSSVAMETQQELLAVANGGARRVLLATDIVESSVTIPDVDVVIDLCVHKRRRWNDTLQVHQLRSESISKDEATQRKGRTGRLRDGVVYRLVTRSKFASLPAHAPSQMANSDIAEILLALYSNKSFIDPLELLEQCPQPPSKRQIDDGFRLLREMGALQERSGARSFHLTPFGHLLQRLPLDIQAAALVINGIRYGCQAEAQIMAGVVLRGMPFLDDQCSDAEGALRLWGVKKACCSDSDLLCALRAYEVWQGQLARQGPAWHVKAEAQWCRDHCLSLSVLREIEEQTVHIQDALAQIGLSPEVPRETKLLLSGRRRAAQKLTNTTWSSTSAPAASVLREMAALVRQTPSSPQSRDLLLRWCIAAAFPHNVLQINGDVGTMVLYTCRRRRYNRLHTFLSQCLGLETVNVPSQPRPNGRRADVPVTFIRPEDAQKALQVAAVGRNGAFPYSRAMVGRKVDIAARKCHHGRFVHASESVCFPPLKPRTMIASAKILAVQGPSSEYYVCSLSTSLPFGILWAVVAASYPIRTQRLGGLAAQFHGVEEVVPFSPTPQVVQLVADLRQHLDKEEEAGILFAYPLVAEKRATLAIRLMQALYDAPPPPEPLVQQQADLKKCPTCNVRYCRGRECKQCWQERRNRPRVSPFLGFTDLFDSEPGESWPF